MAQVPVQDMAHTARVVPTAGMASVAGRAPAHQPPAAWHAGHATWLACSPGIHCAPPADLPAAGLSHGCPVCGHDGVLMQAARP